jgi:hypothetical protein
MATGSDLLEALVEPKYVAGAEGLRFFFQWINAATPEDLGLILPQQDLVGDISAAFSVDYGTPGHKRRILRERARRAIRLKKGEELRQLWMKRLAAKANAAIHAGRALDLGKAQRPRGS